MIEGSRVEAGDKILEIVDNDPFTKGGLFESVHVQRWRKSFFDGKKLI